MITLTPPRISAIRSFVVEAPVRRRRRLAQAEARGRARLPSSLGRTIAHRLTIIVVLLGLLTRDARAADPDPWFGADKAKHAGVSAAIAAGGYTIGAFVFDARGHALLLGGGLALAAGIGKETLDLAGYGDPSWKDLTWDVIGTALGLALAWGVDLLVRGVSDGHPLFVAPEPAPAGAPRASTQGLRIVF